MRTLRDSLVRRVLRGLTLVLAFVITTPAAWAAWPHDAVTHPNLGVSASGQQLNPVGVPDGSGGAFFSNVERRTLRVRVMVTR